jgi:hypothetical protein
LVPLKLYVLIVFLVFWKNRNAKNMNEMMKEIHISLFLFSKYCVPKLEIRAPVNIHSM